MKRQIALICLLLTCHLTTMAQTEVDGNRLSGSTTLQPTAPDSPLQADTLLLRREWMSPERTMPKEPTLQSYTQLTKAGGTGLRLWRGASLGVYGTTSHMPGMMTMEAGSLALHQELGRWHFSAMGIANKYWMPWQYRIATQYGFGGTIGYDLSESVTLHAFGYYYANQMQVGPAMSPYINNTTYGGYADVHFSDTFGANLGVRRYINPMSGKWTTEPIVNPYIKLGKRSKIELPLGGILKTLVWGDRDNPMKFQARPMSSPASAPRPVIRP